MLVKVSNNLYITPEEVSKVLVVNSSNDTTTQTIIFMKDGEKFHVFVPEGITKYENLDRVANIINEGLQSKNISELSDVF
jgi:hypothetical protein